MLKEEAEYFESEEFQEQLRHYEQFQEQGVAPYMDADILTDIAEFYMMREQEDKAKVCIALARDLHPDSITPRVFEVRRQIFHDNVEEARSILEEIPDQEDGEVKFARFELLLKEGRVDEGNALMEEQYKNIDSDRHLYLYDVAETLFENSFYEQALTWVRKLIRKFPKYLEAKLLEGDIYVQMGKYAKAEELGEQLVQEDAFSEQGWALYTEALYMQEKGEKALEASEYLLAINEHNTYAMQARAKILHMMNRMEEAHRQFLKYFSQYGGDRFTLYLDGICLLCLNKPQQAKETLLQALACKEEDPTDRRQIQMNLAIACSKLGEREEAMRYLDELQGIHAPGTPKTTVDVLLVKGRILLEFKETDSAMEVFTQAVNQSERPYDTLLMTGIALGEAGLYERAVEVFLHLYGSRMENAHALTSPYLAFCYYFMKQNQPLTHYLEEAIRENPSLTYFLFTSEFPNTPVSDFLKKATGQDDNADPLRPGN